MRLAALRHPSQGPEELIFDQPPPQVAYRHRGAREGFEVVFADMTETGARFQGQTAAIEDGVPWVVEYAIDLDATWTTRRARVTGRSPSGRRELLVQGDGGGHWSVDGAPAAQLDGCLDVDLESSALTNAFPVHRLALEVGDQSDAPAVYVRAADLAVERLEQRYGRMPDQGERRCFEYAAPAFDFTCLLAYDRHGLVVDYPGIAVRVG